MPRKLPLFGSPKQAVGVKVRGSTSNDSVFQPNNNGRPDAMNLVKAYMGTTALNGGSSGIGNYRAQQLAEVQIDIKNIFSTHRYLPKDRVMQNALYRQIYRYDPIAGPALELATNMPWSEFNIGGITDRTIRRSYEQSYENLDIVSKLPWLSLDYNILGKVCGSLIWDERSGCWSQLLQQNPDFLQVTPVPFLDVQPIISMHIPPYLKSLANSIIRTKKYQVDDKNLQDALNMILNNDRLELAEENTFYIARKASGADYLGTSIYSRIVGLILLESALMNANLTNAFRRAGPIRVVTPTDDTSYYNTEQLDALALMFMEADEDPAGSTIVLPRQMNVENLSSANADQWRLFDDLEALNKAKLNGCGLSDSFINGDSSYGTTEINLNVFLERCKSHRTYFEKQLLINKIAKQQAIANGFYKRTKAEIDHNVRTTKKCDANLILPKIHWAKNLAPVGDTAFIDLLEKAEEKGLPITLRTWAGATNQDLTSEMDNLQQDIKERQEINKYKAVIAKLKTDGPNEPDVEASLSANSLDSQFTGFITPSNFKILSNQQLVNCFRYFQCESSLRNKLPKEDFACFQIFLRAKGYPFEPLTESESDLVNGLIANLDEGDMELAKYLEGILDKFQDDIISDEEAEKTLDKKVTETDEDVKKQPIKVDKKSTDAPKQKTEPVAVKPKDEIIKPTPTTKEKDNSQFETKKLRDKEKELGDRDLSQEKISKRWAMPSQTKELSDTGIQMFLEELEKLEIKERTPERIKRIQYEVGIELRKGYLARIGHIPEEDQEEMLDKWKRSMLRELDIVDDEVDLGFELITDELDNATIKPAINPKFSVD